MREMVFWGAAGQAKVLRECMRSTGLNLIALFENNERCISPFEHVPLFFGRNGFETWLRQHQTDEAVGFLIAIGGDRGKDRLELQEYLEQKGLIALIARHPTAFVAGDVDVGAGSQILANATICVETTIGRGCIINTGAIVEHECRVGDGVHIAPGAKLAGCVEVEPFAMVGTGAVILPRKRIGRGAIVGAGAVVTRDVVPYTVVAGNPARIIRGGTHAGEQHSHEL